MHGWAMLKYRGCSGGNIGEAMHSASQYVPGDLVSERQHRKSVFAIRSSRTPGCAGSTLWVSVKDRVACMLGVGK